MIDKIKKNLGYLNISLFFLNLFTYFLIIGVILRELLFSKFNFYFNSASIVFSNYNTLLLPYVFSSVLCFIFFFIFYIFRFNSLGKKKFKNSIEDNIIIPIFLLAFWIKLLKFLFYGPIFGKLFLFNTLLYGIVIGAIPIFLFFNVSTRYFINVFTCFSLIIICYEVLNISFGKKLVMNEYQQLDEMTLIRGDWVPNENFLKTLDKNEILQLYKIYKQNNRMIPKEEDFNGLNVEDILQPLTLNENFDRYLIFEKNENIKKFKNTVDFFSKNQLEYIHKNMSRGQIDHISYILCPINEYINGRALKEIYFQYGIGSTMLLKKIMDLFGEISIGNYYKTYILHLFYYLLFIFIFYKIFGNNFYFKSSILILILSFYINSYVAVILAPGINPILHFMDIIVLFLLFKYYLNKNNFYVFISFILSIFSIFLNLNYGLMLYLAIIISLFFFFKENEYIKNKKIYLLFLTILFISGFFFYFYLSKLTKSENFIYMLFGFFNFGYSLSLFTAILVYILFGYLSFFIFKDLKNEFKYLFIFCFIYSIEIITYYMQSGLYNHFNLPFTFVMLTFIFALYIYENFYFSLDFRKKYFNIFKKIFILSLCVIILLFAKYFYLGRFGKNKFYKIFNTHKLYQWTINKSDFYSTIPQTYFDDSLEMIKKYSKGEKGIYIISKFDVMVNFLTDRYSKMLNFTLAPSILTQREVEKNIDILGRDKPRYIFVDNDLISGDFRDPYATIFDSDFNKLERDARFERYILMKEIFDSCAKRYKLIEQSKLISVFERKY